MITMFSQQQLLLFDIGIDLFGICELMILRIYLRKNALTTQEYTLFRRVISFTLIALIGDMFSWAVNGQPGAFFKVMNYVSNLTYQTAQLIAAMYIFVFFYWISHSRDLMKKVQIFALDIPFLLIFLCALSTPWTGLVFTVDAQNLYQRGILLPYFSMATLAYIFAASFTCAIRITHETLQDRRRRLRVLACYCIPVILGSMIQTSIYGISLVLPCSVLALFMTFLNEQYLKISVDALTGLNNRGCFDRYLNTQLETDSKEDLVLIMIDINEFKTINDEFGHLKGDVVLKTVADILRYSATSKNVFLARYGGDEFAYILHRSQVSAQTIMDEVQLEFHAFNQKKTLPLELGVAMGAAAYDSETVNTAERLIRKADALMYDAKKSMKQPEMDLSSSKKSNGFWGQNRKNKE